MSWSRWPPCCQMRGECEDARVSSPRQPARDAGRRRRRENSHGGCGAISRDECAQLCTSLLRGERQSKVTEIPNANSEFAFRFWNFVSDFRSCVICHVLRILPDYR